MQSVDYSNDDCRGHPPSENQPTGHNADNSRGSNRKCVFCWQDAGADKLSGALKTGKPGSPKGNLTEKPKQETVATTLPTQWQHHIAAATSVTSATAGSSPVEEEGF